MSLNAGEVAAGYHSLLAKAPSRLQGYLSTRRTGVTSSGKSSNRIEEHLAVALFNKKSMLLPDAKRLRLLDYQFPLKSVQANSGIGKVDLIGLFEDGTLAIVELKVATSLEDRRIGLIEGLIYAAIVEANICQIADEILAASQHIVKRVRPRVLLAAPPRYWSQLTNYPPSENLASLAREIMSLIPIEIAMLSLQNAESLELGLHGRPPTIREQPFFELAIGKC